MLTLRVNSAALGQLSPAFAFDVGYIRFRVLSGSPVVLRLDDPKRLMARRAANFLEICFDVQFDTDATMWPVHPGNGALGNAVRILGLIVAKQERRSAICRKNNLDTRTVCILWIL